ncbi:DUF3606 domain-containing protein [Cupriavidus basilensis]
MRGRSMTTMQAAIRQQRAPLTTPCDAAGKGREIRMSNDPKHFRPLDPGRVNMMDALEVQYWCTRDLTGAVRTPGGRGRNTGDHISAVRARLEALYPDKRHG